MSGLTAKHLDFSPAVASYTTGTVEFLEPTEMLRSVEPDDSAQTVRI